MLDIDRTVLVVVDVQGKLAEIMHEKESLYQNLRRLIMGTKALAIPIVWTEQIPEKMGPTVPQVKKLLENIQPISKKYFSCCGEPGFMASLAAIARKQVILCGIETHVCIFQTAADLLSRGYEVHVPADAVSSRTLSNKLTGLDRIRAAGGIVTSVETALFELMRTAEHPAFREILKIVK
jgi:nicotinamidase-related amidase